jgi:hypothetical protein
MYVYIGRRMHMVCKLPSRANAIHTCSTCQHLSNRAYIATCIHTYIQACMHTCIHTCMYVYMYVCMYTNLSHMLDLPHASILHDLIKSCIYPIKKREKTFRTNASQDCIFVEAVVHCMYVCVHEYAYAVVDVCMCVCVSKNVYVSYVCMCVYLKTASLLKLSMYVCMCVCMYVCV